MAVVAERAFTSRATLQRVEEAQAWERSKLERLCRYITRPAVSEKRL
jgi:hypothetical protein